MSGCTGATRIQSRDDFKKFLISYHTIISQFPGFISMEPTGSYNSNVNKTDFGDIDIVVHVDSPDDKTTVKKKLVAFLNNLSSDIIVPFTSIKHAGKRTYNAGELISVRYNDSDVGYSVQIDNIVALSESEAIFKKEFLNLSAATQGLILGLVKTACIENDTQQLLNSLGIDVDTHLASNQEFEFSLSSVELQLRRVTYEAGTFKQQTKEVVWASNNFNDLKKVLYQVDTSLPFEQLLIESASVLQNPRSFKRIVGVFSSMISVKSGEIGTAKAYEKEQALFKINKTFNYENCYAE
jgi:hypothetical protein